MDNILIINNLKYKILDSEIKFVNAKNNSKKGYSLLVCIDIMLDDIKGYINFYVDFFEEKNFKLIENKIYKELPTDIHSKISLFEIFDTKKFYGYIDSYVILKFSKIDNKNILIDFKIDDENIKLSYKGNLTIK